MNSLKTTVEFCIHKWLQNNNRASNLKGSTAVWHVTLTLEQLLTITNKSSYKIYQQLY